MKLAIALCVNLVLSFQLDRLQVFQQTRTELGSLLTREKIEQQQPVLVNKPFLTQSVMTKINDKFLHDLTKDHEDTHHMAKPDKSFQILELEHMSVYYELVKLFRDEELINHGRKITY